MMKIKDICLKDKCSYRKLVEPDKAFCLFPSCPFGQSVKVKTPDVKPLSEKATVKEIIKRSKLLGLVP